MILIDDKDIIFEWLRSLYVKKPRSKENTYWT